jgi:transposase
MESTGVYWKPVHHILEATSRVILVNARHIKNVPGRKTDVSDSRWLAGLLRHGLLKGSFIPREHVRQWRDFTRLRKVYVENLSDYKRRVHKLFESANIRIDSVISDLFGVTGRNLIDRLADGGEISLQDVMRCTRGHLKNRTKAQELFRSIQGFFTEHHRFQLVSMLTVIEHLEKQIEVVQGKVNGLLGDYEGKVKMLKEVPGIEEVSSHAILGEIGDTLDEFDSERSLAAWAGLCPGNNESAGKRFHGRSPVKKHPFRTIMVEVAWGAVRKKGSYYREKYYRLRARMGGKKAIVAIAHKIVKAVFHILKHGRPYRELGEHYLIELTHEMRRKSLEKQAAKLGFVLVPTES